MLSLSQVLTLTHSHTLSHSLCWLRSGEQNGSRERGRDERRRAAKRGEKEKTSGSSSSTRTPSLLSLPARPRAPSGPRRDPWLFARSLARSVRPLLSRSSTFDWLLYEQKAVVDSQQINTRSWLASGGTLSRVCIPAEGRLTAT